MLRIFSFSLSMLLMVAVAWAAEPNMKMAESSHGFVTIKAENVLYYRYSATFTAEADAKLLFKEGSLILTDTAGKRYEKGWLNITSATAGVARELLVSRRFGQTWTAVFC
jgi:hypothetical protein